MTLSTPIKVLALAGLALILAVGGVVMLVVRPSHTAAPVVQVPVKVIKVSAPATHHAARPAKPKILLEDGLPAAVHQKLLLSREIVAYVYTGASIADRSLLAQVRQGAHAAGVPFVALNVTNEKVAESVFGWAATTADPAVLVVRRPGKVVFQLAGPTDSQTVAQAAASAR
jgi:hypothetical protein